MGRVVSGVGRAIGGAVGGVARAAGSVVGSIPGAGLLTKMSPLAGLGLGTALGATAATGFGKVTQGGISMGTGTGIKHTPMATWQMFGSDAVTNTLSAQNQQMANGLPDPGGFNPALNPAVGGTRLV